VHGQISFPGRCRDQERGFRYGITSAMLTPGAVVPAGRLPSGKRWTAISSRADSTGLVDRQRRVPFGTIFDFFAACCIATITPLGAAGRDPTAPPFPAPSSGGTYVQLAEMDVCVDLQPAKHGHSEHETADQPKYDMARRRCGRREGVIGRPPARSGRMSHTRSYRVRASYKPFSELKEHL